MSAWIPPSPGDLVTCETSVAIILHARVVDKEVRLGGHRSPGPMTLCGWEAAWDTMRPLSAVHCKTCLEKMAEYYEAKHGH